MQREFASAAPDADTPSSRRVAATVSPGVGPSSLSAAGGEQSTSFAPDLAVCLRFNICTAIPRLYTPYVVLKHAKIQWWLHVGLKRPLSFVYLITTVSTV